MNKYCKLLIAIIKANPLIDIITPDINELTREIREETGAQLVAQRGFDYYEIDNPYGYTWERKRFNRRKFYVSIQ